MTATAKKTCSICNLRPIASKAARLAAGMSRDMDYCRSCFDEAGWENTHNDNDHESIQDIPVEKRTASETKEIDGCWICFPELNKAQAAYSPREGTSRAGMTITVSIRATGVEKANEVVAQLDESYEAVKITKPTKRNAYVTKLVFASTVQSFELRWDNSGRFVGGTVTEGERTRKVRNVAEALRLSR